MIVKENIYTLALAYGLAKKQLEFYKKNGNRYYVSLYKGIVYSFEERFKNINEDIDLLAYFGETNAQA
ncbi:MAG: hypothetical protein RL018_1274 [Pseudomonadota bacterium]|jgi:hypothetical protein